MDQNFLNNAIEKNDTDLESKIVHLDKDGRVKKIEQRYSNVQPIWKLLVMIVCSYGLYIIYWFYRNWKYLCDYEAEPIHPLLRTIGLFIPVIAIILVYFQFRKIKFFADAYRVKSYRSPFLASILFAIFFPLGLIIVQTTLNRYWKKKQKYFPTRKWFSPCETVVIVIFSIMFILNLVNRLF